MKILSYETLAYVFVFIEHKNKHLTWQLCAIQNIRGLLIWHKFKTQNKNKNYLVVWLKNSCWIDICSSQTRVMRHIYFMSGVFKTLMLLYLPN